MSGTRFARTGRCRFLLCFGILVLMVGMVAIFHSSQIQLDETREQRLHCEQQQEALNERLTSLVEQKFHLEKNQEHERTEYLESKRNLELKIKDLEEKHEKDQVESQMRYEKLQQAHKLLQSDQKHFKEESLKASEQQLENINGLENKLQSLRSELEKEKANKSGEIYMYKEKYITAEQENQRMKNTLSHLEKQLDEYKSHCDYKPQEIPRKQVAPKPDIARDIYTSTSEKSFNHQDPIVAPKSIKSPGDQQSVAEGAQQKQVPPLSAPKNKHSTAKSEQQVPSASALNAASSKTHNVLGNGSSSTSNTPPLPLPSNQRKQLPENVAPIPEGFDDILQKSNNNEQSRNGESEANKEIINALKSSPFKSGNNNNNNNYEFAQDAKDNENINDEKNLAGVEDIFDSENDADKEHHKQKGLDDTANNDDDEGGMLGAGNDNDGDGGGPAVGDIAVKRNQQQMVDESLKNEIAEDLGKEFDGLRLEEAALDEDDDDDYSNPSRKKADKAVRH